MNSKCKKSVDFQFKRITLLFYLELYQRSHHKPVKNNAAIWIKEKGKLTGSSITMTMCSEHDGMNKSFEPIQSLLNLLFNFAESIGMRRIKGCTKVTTIASTYLLECTLIYIDHCSYNLETCNVDPYFVCQT